MGATESDWKKFKPLRDEALASLWYRILAEVESTMTDDKLIRPGLVNIDPSPLNGGELKYGGERGFGERTITVHCRNTWINLSAPGEGLIRTAFGLF